MEDRVYKEMWVKLKERCEQGLEDSSQNDIKYELGLIVEIMTNVEKEFSRD